MNIKKYIYILALFLVIPLISSCSQDEKIVFTRNLIINDVVTDKEVPVVDNEVTLNVFTGEELNIHGEEGHCTVLTEDTAVARAAVCDVNGRKSVIIYPRKEGKTAIVVTDSNGNYSALHVTVKPSEQTKVNSKWGYIIEAGNKSDSVQISNALNKCHHQEYIINFKWLSQKSGVATISNIGRKNVFKGTFSLFQQNTEEGLQASLVLYNPKSNLIYATYRQDPRHPNCYVKDLTLQFRSRYKSVRKVQLVLQLNEVH